MIEPRGEFDQFDHRKFKPVPAPQHLEAEAVGLPACVVVGEHGKARHRARKDVVRAVVVGEHALGKIRVALSLHFDMDGDPALLPAGERDPHQSVRVAPSELSLAHHLAQLGVLELVALRPVNLRMRLRKVESHEFGEGVFERVFPRAVVIVGGVVLGGWRRLLSLLHEFSVRYASRSAR